MLLVGFRFSGQLRYSQIISNVFNITIFFIGSVILNDSKSSLVISFRISRCFCIILLFCFTAPDNYEPPNVDQYQNAGDDAGDAPGGVKARAVYDYQASKCQIMFVS